MIGASKTKLVPVLSGAKLCCRSYTVSTYCSIKSNPQKDVDEMNSDRHRTFAVRNPVSIINKYTNARYKHSIIKKHLGHIPVLNTFSNGDKLKNSRLRDYFPYAEIHFKFKNYMTCDTTVLSRNSFAKDRNHIHSSPVLQSRGFCSRCTFETGRKPYGFRTSPPWRILFFGSDHFSLSSLKALNVNRFDPGVKFVDSLEVVTSKHKSPVLEYANEAGLKVHHWPITTDFEKYDVGVLSSFGSLIPERVIHMFPYGIINIHPSLLPRWRGASPITHTILNGDLVTGVSIMEIRPKHFDIGPLLMQREIAVPENCTTGQLSSILAPMGTNMVMEVLQDLPTLERCEVEQGKRGITYAHKIHEDMYYIDWANQTMEDISRQYRALHETGPIRSLYQDQKIKLFEFCPMEDLQVSKDYLQRIMLRDYGVTREDQLLPGSALFVKDQQAIIIRCKTLPFLTLDFEAVHPSVQKCVHFNIAECEAATSKDVKLEIPPSLFKSPDGWVGFKHLIVKQRMEPAQFYGNFLKRKGHMRHFVSHPNHLNEDLTKVKATA